MFYQHKTVIFYAIVFQALMKATALYDGFKVYDIYCKTATDKEVLTNLSKLSDQYDFIHLTKKFDEPDRVIVPPYLQMDFEQVLESSLVAFKIFNEDVSRSSQNLSSTFTQTFSGKFNLHKYHSFDEMNDYLGHLSKTYPDLVSVQEFGRSFQDRSMRAIYISNDKSMTKNVVLVDAGIHAREIAAPATALFLINQLVENPNNKELVDAFDWVIVPSANPDGYEFVRSGYILWRRTMTPYFPCAGADPNRNFDFHWSRNGSSPIPCTQNYQGPKPFSEKETRALRNLMFSVKERAKMYLTIHSYGRYLLTPWGHTSDYSENYDDVYSVAAAGRDAMYKATGSNYTVGSSTNVLYAASGSSEDYAYGVAGIPIAITMELPGGGSIGFNPPERGMKNIVSESFIGIAAMTRKLHEIYPNTDF